MAALTLLIPPAQAMMSGPTSKKGTPETVSKGVQLPGTRQGVELRGHGKLQSDFHV